MQYNTKYYYKIESGESSREFWFVTPPHVHPDASYKFGIIGMSLIVSQLDLLLLLLFLIRFHC